MSIEDIQPPPRIPQSGNDRDGERWLREMAQWMVALRDVFRGAILIGSGSPEGVIRAKIGTLYLRRDGGAGTSLYVKESGDGQAAGWAAK